MLTLVLFFFVALAVLTPLFGHDSREGRTRRADRARRSRWREGLAHGAARAN